MTHILFTMHRNKKAWASVLVLAGMLAAASILQNNLLTDTAYRIAAQERSIKQLTEATNELETRYANTASLQDFDEAARVLGFEKISTMEYVRVSAAQVAQLEE